MDDKPFERLFVGDGEIGVVAADITQEQRTGASYYTVRVLLKPEELEKLGSVKLVPGMPSYTPH